MVQPTKGRARTGRMIANAKRANAPDKYAAITSIQAADQITSYLYSEERNCGHRLIVINEPGFYFRQF